MQPNSYHTPLLWKELLHSARSHKLRTRGQSRVTGPCQWLYPELRRLWDGCQTFPWSWDRRSTLTGSCHGSPFSRLRSAENHILAGPLGATRRTLWPDNLTLKCEHYQGDRPGVGQSVYPMGGNLYVFINNDAFVDSLSYSWVVHWVAKKEFYTVFNKKSTHLIFIFYILKNTMTGYRGEKKI